MKLLCVLLQSQTNHPFSIIYPGRMILGTSEPKAKLKHTQSILFSAITIPELLMEFPLVSW